jgi:hypothetical protein
MVVEISADDVVANQRDGVSASVSGRLNDGESLCELGRDVYCICEDAKDLRPNH